MTPSEISRRICRTVSLTPLSPKITGLALATADGGPLPFRAGQYALLSRPGGEPRPYSFANPPDGGGRTEFHITGAGPGNGEALLDHLSVGGEVLLDGPFGEAYYREDHHGPVLGLAGGSGLAPLKSIAEHALARGLDQPFHLYHGSRRHEDLYLDDRLGRLSHDHRHFYYVGALSESAHPSNGRRTGTVCECIAADFTDLSGWKAYVAGPAGMIEAAYRLLRDRGLGDGDIHCDTL